MGARVTQHREAEGERARHEMYEGSCRRHAKAQQLSLAWEWLRYYQGMLRSHQTTAAILTTHHRREIEKYEAMLGINHKGGDAA